MHLYLDRLTKLGYLLAVITMSFGPSLITRIVDRRNIVPRSTTSLLLRTCQTRIFPRRCSRPRLCLHFDMFSMKIGFAAFDQPGQLNRPFNYPIRYTYIYIYLPALKVLASKSERSAQIDWRCTRCFICYSTSSGRWTKRSFARWRFSDRSRFIGGRASIHWIHGMEQYSIRNKPPRSSRYPSCWTWLVSL